MCNFFPVSSDDIKNWDGEDPEFLLKLDSHGIFPAPSENAEDFRTRLLQEYEYTEKINTALHSSSEKILLWQTENGKDKLEVKQKDIIDRKLFEPAFEITRKLYGFAADYIPGFYLFEKVGLLWGGCSIYDDHTQMKVFLLRPDFRKKEHFLIYGRTELLAHELCHCARQPIQDHSIEEYFAYQTSKSGLRRYIGNCFNREYDALIFLFPALLLPIAQWIKNFVWQPLPILPFWIFLALVLGTFLVRNQCSRSVISAARKKLIGLAPNPDAILFRSTFDELKLLSKSFEEYYANLSPLRKKLIASMLNDKTVL